MYDRPMTYVYMVRIHFKCLLAMWNRPVNFSRYDLMLVSCIIASKETFLFVPLSLHCRRFLHETKQAIARSRNFRTWLFPKHFTCNHCFLPKWFGKCQLKILVSLKLINDLKLLFLKFSLGSFQVGVKFSYIFSRVFYWDYFCLGVKCFLFAKSYKTNL